MGQALYIGFLSGAPGAGELLLIFLVVLLLFGPRKLPEFARTLGSLMQQLRRASNDFRDQLMRVNQDVEKEVHAALDDPLADEAAVAAHPADSGTAPPESHGDASEEDQPLAG